MKTVFGFGERVEGFSVPVLNEREVRAAAGILFFSALVSFMNAWLMGNFRLTQIFVIAFLTDFTIRIFVNPRFAPSMILGRFAVRNQTPEWAGAPQKRFAWAFGFALAVAMLYLIVINNVIGPVNLIICATCLTLMFFESAFGICLACKVYNLFHARRAASCPGGACEVRVRHKSQKIGAAHMAVVVLFLGVMAAVAQSFTTVAPAAALPDTAAASDCTPPDWAVAMGHAEMWKLHNNCK
jgi:hypothetical protein